MNIPIRLKPVVKEVVWGGTWLAETLGRRGESGASIGESWEAYSGSMILNGPHAGCTLGGLFDERGASMFGGAAAGCPRFPLLVKFIDARQNLSIQVHPDDRLAQELEGYPYGKTEFWYVLEAAPGAEIVFGLEGEWSREEIRAALETGNADRMWRREPVVAGDVVFIPAGTVHALTAGIVVYELQQDCDITYRLFDWGRAGRDIHLENGVRSIDLENRSLAIHRPVMERRKGYATGNLATCEYFRAVLYEADEELVLESRSDSFVLLTLIEGACALSSTQAEQYDETLRTGDTVLIPAGVSAAISPTDGRATLIAAALR